MPNVSEPMLNEVQMATVMTRVADLDRSVEWYRAKLGMETIHRGADGNTPPYALYDVSGLVLTVWQLAPGMQRKAEDNERNSSTAGSGP
jgi:catechol 2,3-dioxygenase-like lactoylglutathione lyase family enzyme